MDTDSFTLIFEGDIRKFAKNPLMLETEYGTPYAVGIGDAFAKIDQLEEDMSKAADLIRSGKYDTAIRILTE